MARVNFCLLRAGRDRNQPVGGVGNLIPNMEIGWDEIAYIQVGDNPGRKEPTTGEINNKKIFEWLYKKGFDGVAGMEHGNSRPGKEGVQAVIAAYREVDSF